MRTHFCFFLSFLFCLVLSVLIGCGSKANVEDVGADAGKRTTLTINGVEYAFRWCPAGTFMMGSPESEANRQRNEGQRRVELSRGFWMLETQVTQAMWESIMGDNPSNFKGTKLPVECVSWNDCQEFVQKLNTHLAGTPAAPAGFKFSLPTEAQWEYACRAGTTTAYHFGDTLTQQQANFGGNIGQMKEVGSYPANAWGLRDMQGNVWEWCLDWYGVSDRVIRGGSWHCSAERCRSAYRGFHGVSNRNSYIIGLRLALVSE